MQRCSCFLANRTTTSRIPIKTTTVKLIQVVAALCWVVIVSMSDTYSAISAKVAALSSTTLTTSKVGRSQQHQQDRWLVVDFDGTCTIRDTTPLLPRLAYLIESQNNDNKDDEHEQHAKRKDLDLMERLSIFTNLENEYFQRYVEVMRSIESESTIEDVGNNNNNYLHSQLEYSLDRLDCISSEITEKVNKSNILKGLGSVRYSKLLELIQNYQQQQQQQQYDEVTIFEGNLRDSLQLHSGCISILQRYATCMSSNNSWRIGVLSINWCPALIEAVVLNPLCNERSSSESEESTTTSLNFEDIPIWCNTVDENGIVSLVVPGAIAKKERILKLQQQQQQNNVVVYVGDSSTDLLALIQADVGILLMGSKSTIGLAKKFGVTFRSLNDYNNYYNNNDKTTGNENGFDVVWTASDWEEIGSFLNHNDERLH
jgi:2-hydroxy-3-keto-5-methylthiopentenyl-1-phosphate phosphatase